ncbi:MAG: replication-associated recombination protein A [Armatimonadetes bacterium]|nr:replication-associated recombination protein A [Armatimonadota bacterium]
MHQENLFADSVDTASLPLAARMRPRTLDEYVGQTKLLAPGRPLRKMIESGKAGSIILFAPPGCGKTTLAYLIAQSAGCRTEAKSAVTTGAPEIRRIAETAAARKRLGEETLLILDEIHHFKRNQQDGLLGYVEQGCFTLVGVTTENPFFALAPALLSRARVITLQPLSEDELAEVVRRALLDTERGLGERKLTIAKDALHRLAKWAAGDARLALNAIEAASFLVEDGGEISAEDLEEVLQRPLVRYDKQGDYHYDTISAFIKSIRGSDPDAALHYLARMMQAGEDPRFIARRMMISASEDIGNADPQSLVLASAAAAAVERVGMPEAGLILGQAVAYLACAPKSNAAYLAIAKAMEDAAKEALPPVPEHLRNKPSKTPYLYPHDYPGHYVKQQYLPDGDWQTPYYRPTDQGHEARIKERMEKRENQG